MKSLFVVCAAIAILAAPAGGAFAAPTNSEPTIFVIGAAAGTMEADCIKAGGTVSTNADGVKICTVPAPRMPDMAAPPVKSNSTTSTPGREPTN